MYACCETSLFIPNTHRKKKKKINAILFEKCPCSVKVSALHRMHTRMSCFLCSQPYCKTKSTEKRLRVLWGSSKNFHPHWGGVSESNTGEQFCGSGQHRECQNKWVKSQGDLRLQIWHLEERYIRKLTPRKPHTPLIAVRTFFYFIFCWCSCFFFHCKVQFSVSELYKMWPVMCCAMITFTL